MLSSAWLVGDAEITLRMSAACWAETKRKLSRLTAKGLKVEIVNQYESKDKKFTSMNDFIPLELA